MADINETDENETNDLQKINVASKEITQPTLPFFDWLEILLLRKRGKVFLAGWINLKKL